MIVATSLEQIRAALDVLVTPGDVVELRIPNTVKKTISGYFNDLDKMAQVAETYSGKAAGIYFTDPGGRFAAQRLLSREECLSVRSLS